MKLKVISMALALNFLMPAGIVYSAPAVEAQKSVKQQRETNDRVLVLNFGTAENQVGSLSADKKILGFYAPTSFEVKNDDIYILDAPNFRVVKYGPDKKAHKICDLEKTDGKKPVLYTDIAILDDDSILISSGRGALYKFDKTGKFIKKIDAPAEIKMVNKIAADGAGNAILPDLLNGKTVIMGADGKKITALPSLVEPVILPKYGFVKLAKKKDKNTNVVSLKISCPADIKKPEKIVEVNIDEPLRGASVVGFNADGSFVLFISAAKGGDFLDATYALKVSADGRTLKKVKIPLESRLTTIRNIRLEKNGDVLFASEGEEGYIISRYKF